MTTKTKIIYGRIEVVYTQTISIEGREVCIEMYSEDTSEHELDIYFYLPEYSTPGGVEFETLAKFRNPVKAARNIFSTILSMMAEADNDALWSYIYTPSTDKREALYEKILRRAGYCAVGLGDSEYVIVNM